MKKNTIEKKIFSKSVIYLFYLLINLTIDLKELLIESLCS
jgi:hypothetical protein